MFDPPKDSLKEEAFAKINLGLWVLGKRKDGYHEIVTFMHEIDLKDDLWMWRSETLSFLVEGMEIEHDNTVTRTVRKLQEITSFSKGAKILLTKRIPPRSGLGGGSSDAAAAIRGFLKIWNLSLDRERIFDVASQIGSDVPFFLEGGFCLSRGRGERIEKIDFSLREDFLVLLVFPGIGLLTSEVYSWMGSSYSNLPNVDKVVEAFRTDDWEFLRGYLKNDLEKPVFERYPNLRYVKEVLLSEGALISLMSGSGSTIFAIFDGSFSQIEQLKRKIGKGFSFILTRFKRRNG
ncbi:MAG: 4-(cytidine 5'-diphospho)-2-C-methyl-D-erythritol kinase [Synergistetes bacterium]|nr:4-(cytidine 5'-diphospho)-2-C-methyl-D-erythritol kinase [Synergistota bacterium]MDK2871941.1 4-diphosphocytidyl-2-C-methyl-D-erythritol kinase [bacterium]